jgi:hypothetical protein
VAVCDVVQRDTDVVKTLAQFTEMSVERVLPATGCSAAAS